VTGVASRPGAAGPAAAGPAAAESRPAVAPGDPQPRPAAGDIDAVLEGGPADLPSILRRRQTGPTEGKIKVTHRGGYEHFERVGGQDGGNQPVVFCWTTRTRMAE
jgi:hypothetical protein